MLSMSYNQYKHYRDALEELRAHFQCIVEHVDDMQLVMKSKPYVISANDISADSPRWNDCETCIVLHHGQWRVLVDEHVLRNISAKDILCNGH